MVAEKGPRPLIELKDMGSSKTERETVQGDWKQRVRRVWGGLRDERGCERMAEEVRRGERAETTRTKKHQRGTTGALQLEQTPGVCQTLQVCLATVARRHKLKHLNWTVEEC